MPTLGAGFGVQPLVPRPNGQARLLAVDARPIKAVAWSAFATAPNSGQFFVSLGTNFTTAVANTTVGWMDNMHSKQGNVGLADGSVQQFSKNRMQEALKNTGDTGNTPGVFTAIGDNKPAGVNRIQLP